MNPRRPQGIGRGCVALLSAMLLLSSCSISRTLVPGGSGHRADMTLRKDERVWEYTTRDGERHRFEGRVEDAGDSVRFIATAGVGQGLRSAPPAETLTVARADVASIRVSRPDYWATGTILLLLVGVFGYAIFMIESIRE